jgi:hypothetical protein
VTRGGRLAAGRGRSGSRLAGGGLERRGGRLAAGVVAAGLALHLAAAQAGAVPVPAHLSGVASRGVLAARGEAGVRTAFAFEDERTIVVGADAGGAIQLITSSGVAASGEPSSREGRLGAMEVQGLGLVPLRRSDAGEIPAGTRVYVLGSPLGYGADRIRSVSLPTIALASTHLVRVLGSLPSAFEGAPVVTQEGRVIGAVARVGVGTWSLAPRGRLLALVAGTGRSSSAGVPLLSLLAGALVIFIAGAGLGVMRTRRRRRRELEASELRRRRAAARSGAPLQQPLVQLRTPEPESPAPAGEEAEEDFDVILKPREDS